MGVYEKYILPKMVHCICNIPLVTEQRQKLVPRAKGRVLEIGIGSGLNLPFYDSSKVDLVWGLEPCEHMRKMAKKRSDNVPFDVDFLGLPDDKIPLETNSADTVLVTYTLCTIPDLLSALNEMRRVLKPGGEMVFSEHGLSPDKKVHQWQDLMNPIWKKMGGGCNLNRPIPDLIKQGGFKIQHLASEYISPFKPLSYNFLGSAIQR